MVVAGMEPVEPEEDGGNVEGDGKKWRERGWVMGYWGVYFGCGFMFVVKSQKQVERDSIFVPGEMSLVPNFGSSRVGGQLSVPFGAEKRLGFGSVARINRNLKVSRPSEDGIYYIFPSSLKYSSKVAKGLKVRMNLIDENLARGKDFVRPSDILAYDLVQGAHQTIGAQVRWSYILDKSVCDPPPTAVLLHGILGCRKNWGTFARRLAHEFPTWQIVITQFLLVDLRCHGDSAAIKKRGPHTVASTALDILKLLGKLKLTPRVLVGHSFGGKVALSMVDQVAKPLARPVRRGYEHMRTS
ncbi:hypothetical protein RHGRI_005262 [Rhododendron griersonianum]|uniref:AB hydrolase-1 domain-containing protein n=1 Tax=Rhododendron griersonianum TaxID=479676 RepID=A0AAV6LCM7_9ERIC|nr:hypothetical protein RHGRI_005262 [Rhododendron griersonianum]